MSSMVLSSITESGSMAAAAAPPRSPRAAANGPGGGGGGGGRGGGGGGSRTHSSCQPARGAGSSALPLGERSTQGGHYSSQQPPRDPQSAVGAGRRLRDELRTGDENRSELQGAMSWEGRMRALNNPRDAPETGRGERQDYISQKAMRDASSSGWFILTSWQPQAAEERPGRKLGGNSSLVKGSCVSGRFPHMRRRLCSAHSLLR